MNYEETSLPMKDNIQFDKEVTDKHLSDLYGFCFTSVLLININRNVNQYSNCVYLSFAIMLYLEHK